MGPPRRPRRKAYTANMTALSVAVQQCVQRRGSQRSLNSFELAMGDAATRCAVGASASQHLEDILLLPTLLRLAAARPGGGGVFVEAGALDGRRFSNSAMLERCFGWNGVLVEANPDNYARLLASGRKAQFVNAAICNGRSIRMTAGGGEVAAQLDAMPSNHLQRWSLSNRSVEVPCRTLRGIMEAAGSPRADILFLDVEGAEDTALATADPAAFSIVMVERDGHNVVKDERVRATLRRAGLVLAKTVSVPFSDVWVRANSVYEEPLVTFGGWHAQRPFEMGGRKLSYCRRWFRRASSRAEGQFQV